MLRFPGDEPPAVFGHASGDHAEPDPSVEQYTLLFAVLESAARELSSFTLRPLPRRPPGHRRAKTVECSDDARLAARVSEVRFEPPAGLSTVRGPGGVAVSGSPHTLVGATRVAGTGSAAGCSPPSEPSCAIRCGLPRTHSCWPLLESGQVDDPPPV